MMKPKHDCTECYGPSLTYSKTCGAWVCDDCGAHDKLERCFCGWSRWGGDGYNELIEMGEQIEEDY